MKSSAGKCSESQPQGFFNIRIEFQALEKIFWLMIETPLFQWNLMMKKETNEWLTRKPDQRRNGRRFLLDNELTGKPINIMLADALRSDFSLSFQTFGLDHQTERHWSRDQLPAQRNAKRIINGRLNASWKICSLVVNRQSFLVIDGYRLNLF